MGAGGVPILGGMIQGMGANMESEERINQLDEEARVADKNAALAVASGKYNAQKLQVQSGQRIGSMVADYGASGVTSNSGSTLDVLRMSQTNAEMDRLNILYGAELERQNFKDRAKAAGAGARYSAKVAKFKAWSAMFTGGADAASMYAKGGGGGGDSGGGNGYSGGTGGGSSPQASGYFG